MFGIILPSLAIVFCLFFMFMGAIAFACTHHSHILFYHSEVVVKIPCVPGEVFVQADILMMGTLHFMSLPFLYTPREWHEWPAVEVSVAAELHSIL